MNTQERHARARAGINYIKSLGIEPQEVEPYLYQKFTRKDFSLNSLPIYEVNDLSFQINYDTPRDKKNKKFKLESAKTFTVKRRIGVTDEEILNRVEEITNDFFLHSQLTNKLEVQGLERSRFILDYSITSNIEVLENDNAINLIFDKSKRKYTKSVDLLDYL